MGAKKGDRFGSVSLTDTNQFSKLQPIVTVTFVLLQKDQMHINAIYGLILLLKTRDREKRSHHIPNLFLT